MKEKIKVRLRTSHERNGAIYCFATTDAINATARAYGPRDEIIFLFNSMYIKLAVIR